MKDNYIYIYTHIYILQKKKNKIIHKDTHGSILEAEIECFNHLCNSYCVHSNRL